MALFVRWEHSIARTWSSALIQALDLEYQVSDLVLIEQGRPYGTSQKAAVGYTVIKLDDGDIVAVTTSLEFLLRFFRKPQILELEFAEKRIPRTILEPDDHLCFTAERKIDPAPYPERTDSEPFVYGMKPISAYCKSGDSEDFYMHSPIGMLKNVIKVIKKAGMKERWRCYFSDS